MNTAPNRSPLATETSALLKVCAGAMCAWIFVRLASKISKGDTDLFDQRILRSLRRPDDPAIPIGPPWLAEVAQDFTSLGSGATLSLATGIVVGSLCLNRRYRAAGFLVSSLTSGMLLSRLLKNFFLRPRPTVVPKLTHFDPGSFPSGHSMLSALVYLTLGGIVARQTSGWFAKIYFLSVAMVLALLVGLSRMYLGVHYPTDVLAGWAAGSLWSGFCTQVSRWLQRGGKMERPAAVPPLEAQSLVSK